MQAMQPFFKVFAEGVRNGGNMTAKRPAPKKGRGVFSIEIIGWQPTEKL
jgi:hypothetical protein